MFESSAKPKNIDPETVAALIDGRDKSRYTLLDVREPFEYEQFHLPGALHMPLGELPHRLDELPRDERLVVYCASGRRSMAATSILDGAGFDLAFNLPGGANGWLGQGAVGEPVQGFAHLATSADPAQVLAMAYAMELGLGRFYDELGQKSASPQVKEAFEALARFEHGHVKIVERIWHSFGLPGSPSDNPPQTTDLLEGALTPETALGNYPAELAKPENAIDFGMSFEAQALDLYQRLARRAQDPQSVELLNNLAAEERRHLKALGQLLEKLAN